MSPAIALRSPLLVLTPVLALLASACDEQGALPADTTTSTDAATSTGATDTATSTVEDSALASDASTSEDAAPTDSGSPPGDATATTAPTDTGGPTEDATATDATTPADTNEPTDTAIVLPTVRPPVVATHSTGLSGWSMSPQAEATKCVVKRLDNAGVLWVSQIRAELAKGSHHMIIYKSAETEERATPFNCDPFVETLSGETFPLMITQIRNETLAFPNGVAFRFEPYQMVRLEAHFLNYFPETIEASGTVHFDGIAEGDVVSEANMLFYGAPDIDIPKGQSVTTPWYFLDVMPGTRLFALTGHTHQYGTNVETRVAQGSGATGTQIYPGSEPFDWAEAPLVTYDPPIEIGTGTGFKIRCSWNNTTNGNLYFGESANQEMCFIWAYYYPSQGYRICSDGIFAFLCDNDG